MKLFSQLSKRERILLFITIGVIILAGLINFIITPLSKKWRHLNNQIASLNAKLSRHMRILSLEKDIEAKYKAYADYLKVKGSNEEALALVLQEIERHARSSEVVLTNIVPSGLESKDFYNKFEVRMDIEGDMSSLIKFLYELQRSKHLFRILRLSITTKPGNGEILRSSLQLIKIFIP